MVDTPKTPTPPIGVRNPRPSVIDLTPEELEEAQREKMRRQQAKAAGRQPTDPEPEEDEPEEEDEEDEESEEEGSEPQPIGEPRRTEPVRQGDKIEWDANDWIVSAVNVPKSMIYVEREESMNQGTGVWLVVTEDGFTRYDIEQGEPKIDVISWVDNEKATQRRLVE